MQVQDLASIVDDLVEVLHHQAKELERLIAHVEQVTAHLGDESKISVVRSSLSALHLRIKKLRRTEPATAGEEEDVLSPCRAVS